MEAGDLAALLRELKERSGLSYGVLAKRLHMSTSTLHRYVNGTAVPTEFAPVERLARSCRASPEELVEVHRRWIVADAARARRGAEAGAQKPEPEPRREQDAGAGAGTGQEPEPRPESEPEREPRSQPETAPEAVPGPGPEPSRGRRRLTALVGVGAALALGATALAVQAGSSGAADDGRRPVAEASPDGAGRPTAGKPEAGGPGRSAGSTGGPATERASDDEHGTGKGRNGKGADGGKDGGRATSPGGADRDGGAATGTPLTVSTQPQFWDSPCGHPYLVDRAPARLSPPPNEQDAPGWVSANGAVSAGEQAVRLTVQGTGKGTVVLESLHVRVVGTDAPLAWNDYTMGYIGVGCGGNVPKHSFGVNLDAAVPRLTPEEGTGDDFPYTVSAQDAETFYVNAAVKNHHVRWYLELEWSSGGRHGTVRVDDTGKPFRTSGDGGRPQYGYSLDKKGWVAIRRGADGSVTEVGDGAGV
ncbi:helix-turn-helix domain-containing protein [Streptomyces sp. NPDC057555]|uniref:helix-turn-helix domain-containing protein n=1 Tax=Streptomyces sp. NPDC057555 TaxID=3346166 RepID=UPI0036A679C6